MELNDKIIERQIRQLMCRRIIWRENLKFEILRCQALMSHFNTLTVPKLIPANTEKKSYNRIPILVLSGFELLKRMHYNHF